MDIAVTFPKSKRRQRDQTRYANQLLLITASKCAARPVVIISGHQQADRDRDSGVRCNNTIRAHDRVVRISADVYFLDGNEAARIVGFFFFSFFFSYNTGVRFGIDVLGRS